ncbi:diguanylate cyclase [Rhizobium sp. ARZ01]|uniref:GGDEF domain-containing protein n=1 Tax=Rhizobium sp. ARZ01 TaxID=2769313 RepID=UPI00177B0C4F|nr:GGDEF domain-containing protein [Rhizobium sp. ARZ01]MBD9373335.1 diguanylate cyclase [Rhizobium sp. ARZ01]
MTDDSRPVSGLPTNWAHAPRDALLVAGVIFCVALFGITTRPLGLLAAFWPANAVLLGMMIRSPHLASISGWTGAFAGYVAADLLTGGSLGLTLWMTIANVAEAATGYLFFRRLPEDHQRLRWPQSIMLLFAVCCCAAAVGAFVGAGAASVVFERDFSTGLEYWFSTELANAIVVLPVMLTAPQLRDIGWPWPAFATTEGTRNVMPAAALAASILIGSLMEGPGSFAFPVPALLWCAVSYSLFTTAILTLVFSMWGMVIVTGSFATPPADIDLLTWGKSIRLALALIALAPLAVASVNATRNELLTRLQDSVDHDALTRALTRSTFVERSERLLETAGPGTAAFLMLDVDLFKSVNDRYGHAAGDAALVAFAGSVRQALRKEDLFGRLGGEEFAVYFPRTTREEAEEIAEHIRRTVEKLPVDVGNGRLVSITVSGGLAIRTKGNHSTLDALFARADAALYRAKAEGRNRIIAAE